MLISCTGYVISNLFYGLYVHILFTCIYIIYIYIYVSSRCLSIVTYSLLLLQDKMFFSACAAGHLPLVKNFIAQGVNVNWRNRAQVSRLMNSQFIEVHCHVHVLFCFWWGNYYKTLFSQMKNFVVAQFSYVLLWIFMVYSTASALTVMCFESIQYSLTPLIAAAGKGHTQVVHCLVEHGAAIDDVDEVKWNLIKCITFYCPLFSMVVCNIQ